MATAPLVIRKTILAELAGAAPHPLPQSTVLVAVRRLIPDLELKDLVDHLAWLRDHSMADFNPDRFEPDVRDMRRWFITDAGLAALKA